VDHEHAKELETMSAVLDELPQELWEAVERDLTGGRSPNRGRKGMTPEQVVRILLVKQMTGISYDRLVLVLLEFTCYRNFCRIELDTDALGHRGPRPVVLETLPPPSDPVGQRIRLDNLGSPTIPVGLCHRGVPATTSSRSRGWSTDRRKPSSWRSTAIDVSSSGPTPGCGA
jgi:hypothetical protein